MYVYNIVYIMLYCCSTIYYVCVCAYRWQHNLCNGLSSGGTLRLERISPQVIVLNPPEKLVLETQASGEYQKIQWTRNGYSISTDRVDPFFVSLPHEFVNFFEIFVRKPTMKRDLGVYRVSLQQSDGQAQTDGAVFYVTPYSKYRELYYCIVMSVVFI